MAATFALILISLEVATSLHPTLAPTNNPTSVPTLNPFSGTLYTTESLFGYNTGIRQNNIQNQQMNQQMNQHLIKLHMNQMSL